MKIMTPIKRCILGRNKLQVRNELATKATLIDFSGATDVHHVAKRCVSRQCRTGYLYNYRWQGNEKVNSLHLGETEYVFVTAKIGFSEQFIRYHSSLQFRGFLSAKAIAWAAETELGDGKTPYRLDLSFDKARQLLLAMEMFQKLDEDKRGTGVPSYVHHLSLDRPITDANVSALDTFMHKNVLPALNADDVHAVVADGHEKVLVRLCAADGAPARAGRPRDNGQVKRCTNGWFMLVDPTSQRILAVSEMKEPENNAILLSSLRKILPQHPNLKIVIYDRACKVVDAIRADESLKQVTHAIVDKWHGAKHGNTCKCNPCAKPSLMKKVRKINTSAAEQVFAWFRGYASCLNSTNPVVHRFLVLYYVMRHNKMIADGMVSHLNPYAVHSERMKAARREGYVCKRPAGIATDMPMKKRPAAARAV